MRKSTSRTTRLALVGVQVGLIISFMISVAPTTQASHNSPFCDVQVGTSGPDQLGGDSFCDDIYGRGDNDLIHGWASDDDLYGEEGPDLIYGGDGLDGVFGGPSTNTNNYFDALKGEHGHDTVTDTGDQGDNDVVCGGLGYDHLSVADNDSRDSIWWDSDDTYVGVDGNDYASTDNGCNDL